MREEGLREESLEVLEEHLEKRWAREEEDEEVALEELIEAMASRQGGAAATTPEGPTQDEFICTSCNLVRSRRCLADEDRLICGDCAAEHRRSLRRAWNRYHPDDLPPRRALKSAV